MKASPQHIRWNNSYIAVSNIVFIDSKTKQSTTLTTK